MIVRMEAPKLFQRHRVLAWGVVLALFLAAVVGSILQSVQIEEAEEAAKQQAAARQAEQLKADFQANHAKIEAAIRADLAQGRRDEADALIRKYRPVADGSLERLR